MRKQLLVPQREAFWGNAIPGPKVDVRKLLSRVPDDVVLSAVTRELVLNDGSQCLCAWVVREELLRTTGEDDELFWSNAARKASDLFGGSQTEWNAVYMGVTRASRPVIETAWVERVDKAVTRSLR